MNNSYDEIKNLLKSSRNMFGEKTKMNETREQLIKLGLLNEQSTVKDTVINELADLRIEQPVAENPGIPRNCW